jgi:hypothetical protein
VERVPVMDEDVVEQLDNVEEMEEQSGDVEENSSGVINLYGTGPILVVDKRSASLVFGKPLDFSHITYT